MRRVPALIAVLAVAFARAGQAAPASSVTGPVTPVKVAGGYAVVVSAHTLADAQWGPVARALAKKYSGRLITWDREVDETRAALAHPIPRYACFVATPEEASREFVISVNRLARTLDSDPYSDLLYGILTGYNADDAMAAVRETRPLVIHKGASGTGLPMQDFDEAVQYSEGESGAYSVKTPDGKVEQRKGPQDSTAELVDAFNTFHTDLFVTSGHASERNWQIGYSYQNGYFVCKNGMLFGLDMQRKLYPIHSSNPKVYLPMGNCLMGHIADRQSMALAFMHSGGVRQMIGYTVETWYGYMGWGIGSYFLDQPGRFTLAESFLLSNQALTHRLLTEFPPSIRDEFDRWSLDQDGAVMKRLAEKLRGSPEAAKLQDLHGLLWDRDTVAFYGDPAYDARIAPRREPWNQTLSESHGTMTITLSAPNAIKPSRPPAVFLPHRIKSFKILAGADLEPVIAHSFVLFPKLTAMEQGKEYRLVFRTG